MVMGLGFIQQEIDQSSLLILLTFIFASIIGSFSFAILHSLFSVVGNRFGTVVECTNFVDKV